MTIKSAKQHLARVGCTLSKRDGEYRVRLASAKPGDGSGYFTTDIEDAVQTGQLMAVRAGAVAAAAPVPRVELGKYVIITATQECYGDGRAHANLVLNSALRAYLSTLPFRFESCTGFYKGVDQGESFIVYGMGEAVGIQLANKLGQESFISQSGLVYVDGRGRRNAIATLSGEEARATGNYTKLASGHCFSFRLEGDAI